MNIQLYEYMYTHSTLMSISEGLNRLELEFHEVSH
jgi:hypothetical protein